jgi:Glycosyltransferase family 6
MKTALLLIATGDSYEPYIRPLIDSADKFFVPHDTILFTDRMPQYTLYQVPHPHWGFPNATLRRYHTFLAQRDWLATYDYLFYLDVDALFVAPVGEEVFSSGIAATLHHNQNPHDLLETRPQSAAYLPKVHQYFCGGFNGGTSAAYLDMAEAIREGVDYDTANGLTARWHDESHLNKYLSLYPPTKILPVDYCYPEPDLNQPNKAKIVCLEKKWRGGR